jgi:hypothetical protein
LAGRPDQARAGAASGYPPNPALLLPALVAVALPVWRILLRSRGGVVEAFSRSVLSTPQSVVVGALFRCLTRVRSTARVCESPGNSAAGPVAARPARPVIGLEHDIADFRQEFPGIAFRLKVHELAAPRAESLPLPRHVEFRARCLANLEALEMFVIHFRPSRL